MGKTKALKDFEWLKSKEEDSVKCLDIIGHKYVNIDYLIACEDAEGYNACIRKWFENAGFIEVFNPEPRFLTEGEFKFLRDTIY